MSEIWETIDDLFRDLKRQSNRVAELELRLARLEQNGPENTVHRAADKVQAFPAKQDRLLERAA